MAPISRRQLLRDAASGFGSLALVWLLDQDRMRAESTPRSYDLRPRKPDFAAKVKSVIYLYMGGGPSTIDMFDPKPALKKYDGQDSPTRVSGRRLGVSQKVMASPWEFTQYGESGRWVSELMPNFAKVVDHTTFLRAVTTDRVDHSTAQFTALTGRGVAGFPSIGSWAAYGLGSENQDLPAFVALEDTYTTIRNRVWGSAWLPPVYQGTRMNVDGAPIFDVARPKGVTGEEQSSFLRLVNDLNRVQKRQKYSRDLDLEARIANYELAARMQLAATKIADLSKETDATRKLYGLDDPKTSNFSTCCLMSRRLVEHGVRFITVVNGGWDHHSNIKADLPEVCHRTDRGIFGLLSDLKSRGLLDSTLVVWGGEFGRLPTVEQVSARPGRDHNPHGFSIWMAGGGLKPGFDLGDTDEIGYAALDGDKVTHSDVHATILHLLGLDFKKLTFEYEGRDESLTGVNPARVITGVLA
ncbi:MAG: DUF1501 domain-containing protein [Terriglobia bacterium]